MKSIYLASFAVILAYSIVCTVSYPLESIEEELYDTPQYRDADLEPNPDLRKLLLKKLRFRQILKDNMFSPDEILESTNDGSESSETHHKASKRRKVDDLMSRVKALLSDIKERQIKESMTLPSLRFGRSGLHYKH